MDIRCLLAILSLAGVACHSSPTGPPSGLPVTLSWVAAPLGGPPVPAATITAAGDSVVVVGGVAPTCSEYHADAGLLLNRLVATITVRAVPVYCTQILNPARNILRMVVHQAPAGNYEVVVNKSEVPIHGHTVTSELTRRPITLP
ncbi:MAG: hypothetical protein NVS4B3_03850 [Gemmatimonadaceae bacterium]